MPAEFYAKGTEVSTVAAHVPSSEIPLEGRYVTLESLSRTHISSLWQSLGLGEDGSVLEWLPWTVPITEDDLWELFEALRNQRGFFIYAVVGDPNFVNSVLRTGENRREVALGTIGYLDISPKHRTLETGAVLFGKALRRSAAATEAHYLLLRNVFSPTDDAPAYRRVAWKNHSLNTRSRRAAERIGYVYEGRWRNHMIVKGRSRDSDWLSIVENEWPKVELALQRWLAWSNFDESGRHIRALDEIRGEIA